MSFTIHLAPSGHEFSVGPNETVLEAALRQGIGLPYGCRSGNCGSCAAGLRSGQVGYPAGQPSALDGQPAGTCLLCQAVPESDLQLEVREVETPQQIEVRMLPCRVVRLEHLSHDVVRLFLKLPEGERLQYLAGQYLDFVLSDGRRRAFSIANAPHADELIELHVRHVPGGEFTDYVFNQMQEKALLRIQGPLGTFFLREDSTRPIILMGGGTGFAPLKGIIEHALHIGMQRPMHLFWGVRSQKDLYLADLPEQWSSEHGSFRYTPVLSEPDADWSGASGWVHEEVLRAYPELGGFDLYMSGPPVMIDAAKEAFLAHGLPLAHLFSDAFEYATDKQPATT